MKNSALKRDSKDPMPNADNSFRIPPDGNSPVTGEKHGQGKAERVTGSQRFSLLGHDNSQAYRKAGDGNTPVDGEDHSQKKAEYVTAAQRGGENTGGNLENSPGR